MKTACIVVAGVVSLMAVSACAAAGYIKPVLAEPEDEGQEPPQANSDRTARENRAVRRVRALVELVVTNIELVTHLAVLRNGESITADILQNDCQVR